jgi:hypothetical protein
MTNHSPLLIVLAAAGVLSSAPALALETPSGRG